MKVLMFGWEFPPKIYGGLAVASYGITKGLSLQGDMETTFCLPKPCGELCCIGGDTLTASVISENTGLSASHTSKVIRSIEEKELIVRNLGDKDKRQMHFTLSDKGHECLEALKANEIEIPELLKPLFK